MTMRDTVELLGVRWLAKTAVDAISDDRRARLVELLASDYEWARLKVRSGYAESVASARAEVPE